jgi:hypothetical protein
MSNEGGGWIVMELIRGESLHDVLQRGALEPAETARIGLAVVGALEAAHAVGIVHRDVKPANVLLGPHGRVILTDFGIAHIQGEESLTTTGEFVGSLEFIAPERMSGRGAGPASDLWSLGVLLYAAVEGWSPFRRTTVESTLAAILTDEPPEPKQAGPLGPLIVRLLAKDAERRPGAVEAARALEAVAEGRPDPGPGPAELHGVLAADAGTVRLRRDAAQSVREPEVPAPAQSVRESQAPTPAPDPAPRRRIRTPLLAATVAGVLLLVVGVWLGISFRGGDPRAEAQDRGGAASSASASASPSTASGWTAHDEKALDAIVSVTPGTPERSRYDSGADRRNPSRTVVYGDKTVQLRLTREESVPSPIKAWAQEATLSWNDDNADTLFTPTSFHGYKAMLTDTTYEVKDERYRVMQLLIVTDAQEHYELRVDMPKGTAAEKKGTALFKGARARLEVGKAMVGS